MTYYIFYLPVYLLDGGCHRAYTGLGQMIISLMRLLISYSGFKFIAFRMSLKENRDALSF